MADFWQPRDEPVTQEHIDAFMYGNHNQICETVTSAISQITRNIKEHCNMLPAPAAIGTDAGAPKRGAAGKGLPWFRVENLDGESKTATVQKLVMEATQYSDFAAVVTVDGRDFLLGMRADKQGRDVYGVLYSKFGGEEKDWMGQTFELYPKLSEISGKYYLAARIPAPTNGKAKRG